MPKGNARPWEGSTPTDRTEEILALVEAGCDRCDKGAFGQNLVEWIRKKLADGAQIKGADHG